MQYVYTPELIVAANRERTRTLEELTNQVSSLARMVMDARRTDERLAAEAAAALTTPRSDPLSLPRTLDTDFVISATRAAHVFYTLELTAALSLLGTHTDDIAVALIIAGVIQASTVKNLLTATIVLGLALTLTHQKVLAGYVPAGATVRLVSSGSGTATLVQSLEVLL